MIPIYKPYINENNLKYAYDALNSTFISSSIAPYINVVEKELSSYYNVDYFTHPKILTTSSGTTALHLCARLLKKKYPNIKKIIAPNNVYVAAWNAFLFDNNYELETLDADIDTWNINLDRLYYKLEKEDFETTALLIVHNIGNIINVCKIKRDFPNLIIIEDNCEGFGGYYEGKPSGSVAFASAISFFGNKNITSGEGGAIIAAEADLDYLLCLRSQGQSKVRFIHDELGYNYRMTNLQAAILAGQIKDMPKILELKELIFNQYKNLLKNVTGVFLQKIDIETKHSNWMFGIRIGGNKSYDNAEKFFRRNHIEIRPMFYPINCHKYLKNIKYDSIDIANQLHNEILILPSHPFLQDHEISHIVNTLKEYIKSII